MKFRTDRADNAGMGALSGKRVGVIGQIELGSHLAHAINVVKTAGGFQRLGAEVAVCTFAGRQANAATAGKQFGEPELRWLTAPASMRHDDPGAIGPFAAWAAEQLAGRDLVYARSFGGGLACAAKGVCTVIETHSATGDPNPMLLQAFDAAREGRIEAIVTISERLRADYLMRGAARVHVVPDGVDLQLFERPAAFRRTARSRPRVVYAGHLYDYKGVPTLLAAAEQTPGVDVVLVGGLASDVARVRGEVLRRGLVNVELVGAVEHTAVPPWLWDADVLVLPPEPWHASAAWTSPVKLGEYLASGTPIVASGIAALRDWVDEPAVRWFEPGDPASFSGAISRTLAMDARERDMMRGAAMDAARRFAYPERARAIARAAGLLVAEGVAA